MKLRILLYSSLMMLLSSCEMGGNENGPYKSYLLLKAPDQNIVRFHLGGHKNLDSCIRMVQYEVDNAISGKYFWSNSDYSYGGREQEGWIKHEIAGVICETEDRNKGWKILDVRPSNEDETK